MTAENKSTSNNGTEELHLSGRFTSAIDYARHIHIERRKGTGIPYMAHLLGVASLVMGEAGHAGFPVTDDMVTGTDSGGRAEKCQPDDSGEDDVRFAARDRSILADVIGLRSRGCDRGWGLRLRTSDGGRDSPPPSNACLRTERCAGICQSNDRALGFRGGGAL